MKNYSASVSHVLVPHEALWSSVACKRVFLLLLTEAYRLPDAMVGASGMTVCGPLKGSDSL